MAIYHFSGTVISRSQGRSAVACSAYRSAEKLHDEKYDKDHDYTHKEDVAHTDILLPANAPQWMADREKLWNAVEANEKRKDAQLAREFNFALPRELTIEQNIELARDFVKETFVKEGMVADLCIHNDRQPDGEMHPHAHVMLTMREVTQDGFGQKVRAWNDKAMLLHWREEWAEVVNKHLVLHGHDLRIDHRTLAEQGIDLEPQHKIGAAVAQDRFARMEDHQRIARENGERLLERPEIIFDALTHQQSTFTHHDIAKLVNRHTVDQEQFQAVYEKVKASPQLVSLGMDDKNRERFTTQAVLTLESKMVDDARELAQQSNHLVPSSVDQGKVVSAHALSNEQREVLNYAISGGDLVGVVGYAGTGKSRLLGAVKEIYEASGYRVLGATLSGIAAENLEAASGIDSRTLASRFHYWGKGEELLGSRDVLVIDEAGMIGSKQMADVLSQAKTQGAKVIMVGDPEQLQAIQAGAAFRSVIEHTSHVELTEIWRQKEDWQKQATIQFATQKTGEAIAQYAARDCVHEFATGAEAKQAIIDEWNDARIAQLDKTQIMLAYTKKDVYELNQMARSLRQTLGELGEGHAIETERGERQLSSGDRIYFLKNDRDLGVKNGTLGTILDINDKSLSVQIDKEGVDRPHTVTFSTERYNHLDYGYAATIHKAQGVTVDRTYVLASSYLDRHASYVAMSRHREGVELFFSRDVFPEYGKMVDCLSRERAKDITLDYNQDSLKAAFARYRGMDSLWDGLYLPSKEKEVSRDRQVLPDEATRLQDTTPSFDLAAFKLRFEAEHPALAKKIRKEVGLHSNDEKVLSHPVDHQKNIKEPHQKDRVESHRDAKSYDEAEGSFAVFTYHRLLNRYQTADRRSHEENAAHYDLTRHAYQLTHNDKMAEYLQDTRTPELKNEIDGYASVYEKYLEKAKQFDKIDKNLDRASVKQPEKVMQKEKDLEIEF